MADLDHIKDVDNDITYNIKDATSRDDIATLQDDVTNLSGVLADKMDKVNPTGSGAFSMNRRDNTTVGPYSSTLGFYNMASGDFSHAEGESNTASGDFSHAEGVSSVASRSCSHAEGRGVYALSECQHVSGKYNRPDAFDTYAEIIGNGSDDDNRSNARTLDWQGNETIAGDLYFNGGSDSLSDQLANKQNTLVSGTNIKTVNGSSILGSGNINTPDTKPNSGTYDSTPAAVPLASDVSWSCINTTPIVQASAGSVWIIQIVVQFPNNTSGFRGLGIATTNTGTTNPAAIMQQTQAPANGAATNLSLFTFAAPTSATNYYIWARQNSGSSMNVTYRYRAIRLL